MPNLQVTFTRQGVDETPQTGTVAAWTTVPGEGDPTHGYHALAGYADPIMAAKLLEEAIADEGAYVWVIPDTPEGEAGPVQLDGLLLVYGADVHTGRVRNDSSPLDPPPSGEPTEVPAVDSPGDGDGPRPLSPATASRGLPPVGGGLIQAATGD